MQTQENGSKWINGFKSLLRAGDWIDEALAKINNLTSTNYELGLKMAREGRNKDAIFRFRVTLWLAPDHEPSLYNLACLYQHEGESQKALTLLQRILRAHPNHTNALYRVACIDPSLLKPELRPQTVPPIQVAEYFNTIAPFYDAASHEENYRLPALLYELLVPLMGEDYPRRDLLDIGCGTGLCGHVFGGMFTNIIGVDISENMQEIAYRRLDKRGVRIYSQLILQDIRHYLARGETPSFDLALAMDVLPYIGEMQLLAKQLGQKLRGGAMLAISFTPHKGGEEFGVLPQTGYFGHSLAYVQRCLAEQGFEMIRSGEVEARTGQFAQLCFFRKNDTAAHVNASQS